MMYCKKYSRYILQSIVSNNTYFTNKKAVVVIIPKVNRIMSSLFSTSTTANDILPVQSSITSKLKDTFKPTFLKVINESHMHNVPINSETHFKVVVVSEQFETEKSLLKRHRMINETLKDELKRGPLHALSIVAKSPSQWEQLVRDNHGEENVAIAPSPNCRGGDGSLPKRHG